MAVVKVKIVSSIAGENFSYSPGEVVDLDEAVAREWHAAGLSVTAPEGEVAAATIAELTVRLGDAIGARDGLAAQVEDLKSKLANAQGEKSGAIADKVLAKKAADDARAAQAAAETALDAALAQIEAAKAAAHVAQ